MAKRIKKVQVFDKGLVTELGDQSIPSGAASDSNNFLHLGDRLELMRGQFRLGDAGSVSGHCFTTVKGIAVDGTEVLFKKIGTKIRHYDPDTELWEDALTGLPDEDLTIVPYRTPAGSFLWASSPNSGLYRVNLANPLSWVNFYDAAKNFKGYITIQDNRMFLWGNKGAETVIYLSYIDDDFPYTAIANENIGTGNGVAVTFTGSLAQDYIVGRSINNITDGVETFTDDGMGVLTGSAGGTGTINYTTGAFSVTFNAAPAGAAAITIDYQYEIPATHSLADFTYSATRTAGQGDFIPQYQGSEVIRDVKPYDGKFYCLHDRNIWLLDLTDDDTGALNKIYRDAIGAASLRSSIATGDGIYFIDDSDATNKRIRRLSYDELGAQIIPKSISDQLDLDDFVFDESCGRQVGDFLIWSCKSSSDVSYNDTVLVYNRQWKLWDKGDGLFNDFEIYDGKLYGASSVSDDVFEFFSGFDDDGSPIFGSWTAGDDILETEELKKVKKLLVEGDMATSQEIIVEASYDGGPFVEVGRIAGDSEYVDLSAGTEYGVALYGEDLLGSGEHITAYHYMRLFRLENAKFYRARVRFRTEEIGYLNIRSYRWDDIRIKRLRAPAKFRGPHP